MTDRNQDFTPLPNEVYDVIAALHEKSMALDAYEQYVQDAQDDQGKNLWQQMVDLERQGVQKAEDELVRLLRKHNRWG
ncbi:MAG: hypothetical protein M3220_11860 [Chloroflexota bacterium]|nr:hypothetical protein [Chloroflexota bacterium]